MVETLEEVSARVGTVAKQVDGAMRAFEQLPAVEAERRRFETLLAEYQAAMDAQNDVIEGLRRQVATLDPTSSTHQHPPQKHDHEHGHGNLERQLSDVQTDGYATADRLEKHSHPEYVREAAVEGIARRVMNEILGRLRPLMDRLTALEERPRPVAMVSVAPDVSGLETRLHALEVQVVANRLEAQNHEHRELVQKSELDARTAAADVRHGGLATRLHKAENQIIELLGLSQRVAPVAPVATVHVADEHDHKDLLDKIRNLEVHLAVVREERARLVTQSALTNQLAGGQRDLTYLTARVSSLEGAGHLEWTEAAEARFGEITRDLARLVQTIPPPRDHELAGRVGEAMAAANKALALYAEHRHDNLVTLPQAEQLVVRSETGLRKLLDTMCTDLGMEVTAQIASLGTPDEADHHDHTLIEAAIHTLQQGRLDDYAALEQAIGAVEALTAVDHRRLDVLISERALLAETIRTQLGALRKTLEEHGHPPHGHPETLQPIRDQMSDLAEHVGHLVSEIGSHDHPDLKHDHKHEHDPPEMPKHDHPEVEHGHRWHLSSEEDTGGQHRRIYRCSLCGKIDTHVGD